MSKDKNGTSFLKKVGHLIEEEPAEPEKKEEKPEGTEKEPEAPAVPQNRNKALILYISLLFSVAFLLVLFSFFQQMKSSETISQLNANASSALSHAEQLQNDNRQLQDENRVLREENTELRDGNEDLMERMTALQDEKDAVQNQLTEALDAQAAAEAAVQNEKDNTALVQQAYELLIAAESALDQELTKDFEEAMTQLKDLTDYLSEFGQARYEELAALIHTN